MKPRTQTSLAVSGDGVDWILLNASPDLRAQLAATPELHPRPPTLRDSPIASVVLTGAEIDQTAGLLNLREGHAFTLHATAETLATLDANPMFAALARDKVARQPVGLDEPVFLPGGVSVTLFPVAGKVPLYLEGSSADLSAPAGGNVGVEISAGAARIAFIPGAARMDDELRARLARVDAVFFDGTLFTDDEMRREGVGPKTGRRMGHMPISGADGSLAALARLTNRRIYIHLNNTNPVLIDGSPEREVVAAAGWEVAYDGLRIAL